MYLGRAAFSQLIDFVPRHVFRQIVKRYKGELTRSGDARRALECYQGPLKLVRELATAVERQWSAATSGKRGPGRGETRLAIECHSEQLQIAREIGDRHTEGCALWNTNLALDKPGSRLQAFTHAVAAREIFEETGDAECARVRKTLAEWAQTRNRAN